jgi:type IV pilus assembly protein PilB
MEITVQKIKEILLKSGFVSEEELNKAIKTAEDLEKPLLDILMFRGLINDALFGQLVAEEMNVPYVSLDHFTIPLEILELVPEKMARAKKCIPFKIDKQEIDLAMQDPHDLETIELVKKKTGMDVQPFFVTEGTFNKAMSQYKKNIKYEFEAIIKDNLRRTHSLSSNDLEKIAEDMPVVKTLNTIMEYAIAEKASDVHLEQAEERLIIRMRIDGVLKDIIQLTKEMAQALIARIKILSNLKIDEHRVPQDGRFKFVVGEEKISLRVSIVPGFYGENIVLRLLFESGRPLSLEELGITGKNMEIVKEAMAKPHGMFLVTGPTGSGKTTTLYSVLNMLNSTEVKICTIEDPVEYDLHRLTQIQVNTTTGLTFAAGLRSLLRHDPDIIMVGEIRDRETAEIAIHSALTGHLVLSTLHTNDAPSSLPRLIDMGVEPFLLTATINIIIAQRLVRRICTNCIHEIKPDPLKIKHFSELVKIDSVKQNYYSGKGCQECGDKGFKGRIGIYEIIRVNEDIRTAILAKRSPSYIREIAQKQGMISMLEDGFNKITTGQTTIEEVLRVVEEV